MTPDLERLVEVAERIREGEHWSDYATPRDYAEAIVRAVLKELREVAIEANGAPVVRSSEFVEGLSLSSTASGLVFSRPAEVTVERLIDRLLAEPATA